MAEFIASKYRNPTLDTNRHEGSVELDRFGNALTRKVLAYHEHGTVLEWAYETPGGLQAIHVEPSVKSNTVKVDLVNSPFHVVERALVRGWADKPALNRLRRKINLEWEKFRKGSSYFHMERLPARPVDSIIGPGAVGVRDGSVEVMIADNRWCVPEPRGSASFPREATSNVRDLVELVTGRHYYHGYEHPSTPASAWSNGKGGLDLRQRLACSILGVVMNTHTSLDVLGIMFHTSYGTAHASLIYKYGSLRAKKLNLESYSGGVISCLEGNTIDPAKAATKGSFIPSAHLDLAGKLEAMNMVESLRIAGSM